MDFLSKRTVSQNMPGSAKQEREPRYTPHRPTEGGMWDQIRGFLWETFKVIIISLMIIIPIRFWVMQPFYVKGASMEPNFFDNEYLIIDEISYRFSEPVRGDIAVFRYPRDPKQFFIKRIVGMPSEEVQVRDGEVRIIPEGSDGYILDESGYLVDTLETRGSVNIRLGSDEYYVLGDNRGSSLDSRSFGPLTRDAIVGKAWLRGWPLSRLAVFERPEYGN